MNHLRASDTYVWSTEDMLGEGATANVYKARHKLSGKSFAVKIFNRISHMRPLDVQMREFDVLKKLNHRNIVKLLAVEEEKMTHAKVIVMELCTGGSLFNILDDPVNAYGVEETEFFRVLHDVAAGMKHLRDQDTVHRDIKPGNIMKYIYEDGRHVYKLTDFGAARELQDEEQFISLYGTEEYLHPDLYERAVLRRQMGKQFGVTVDLWSLGVTLYHVAAGHLPFRPFGGRKNKETMHKITTEKASGVISGIQNSEHGPIQWSRELPKQCQLSVGAKILVTPLLAGILECTPEKMWSFDKFFEQVAASTNKRAVHIYNVNASISLIVYIDRKEGLAKLQELIAVQTDIRANDQLLIFDNCLLTQHITPLEKAENYPETSVTSPIFLFKSGTDERTMPWVLDVPQLPEFTTGVSLDTDMVVAKRSASIVYLMKRLTTDICNRRLLMREAVHIYSRLLSKDIEHLSSYVTQFSLLCEETERRLKQFIDSHQLQMCTLNILLSQFGNYNSDITQLQNDLSCLVNNHQTSFTTIMDGVSHVKKYMEDYNEKVCTGKQLLTKWSELLSQQKLEYDISQKSLNRLKNRLETHTGSVHEVFENFKRDKFVKRLSFNEEQIHKFDRTKLEDSCTKITAVMNDIAQKMNADYNCFLLWFSEVSRVKVCLGKTESKVGNLSEKQADLSNQLTQCTNGYSEKVRMLLKHLAPDVSLPNTSHSNGNVENVSRITTDSFGGHLTTDGEDEPQPGTQSKALSGYSRSLIKELNKCLFSLKTESAAVKLALQENSDMLKQLEGLNTENER